MAPAANRHATNIRMAVAVIAPADRFQHPDKPVQKAQKTATKLKKKVTENRLSELATHQKDRMLTTAVTSIQTERSPIETSGSGWPNHQMVVGSGFSPPSGSSQCLSNGFPQATDRFQLESKNGYNEHQNLIVIKRANMAGQHHHMSFSWSYSPQKLVITIFALQYIVCIVLFSLSKKIFEMLKKRNQQLVWLGLFVVVCDELLNAS
jgi:hypothetical protein